MARIIGVEVPPNKRIEIGLRTIYGIGPTNSRDILAKANIDPGIRAKDLTEQQLSQIVHAIPDGKYVIEGDLRGLPVRGQRTQTKARTRKCPRKTVGVVRSPPAKTGIH